MDIMLASFGLAQEIYWQSKRKASSLQKSFFYDVPPFFRTARSLAIDVTPFILYDKIIINKTWIEQKSGLKGEVFSASILNNETVNELVQKGIVEPHDYASDTNNHLYLLEKMTDHDLAHLDSWRDILRASSLSWYDYEYRMRNKLRKIGKAQLSATPVTIRNMLAHSGHMLFDTISTRSALRYLARERNDSEYSLLLEATQGYLLSVNNSLLLSREYSAGLFDWFDYEPFYSAKIMWSAMGATSPMSTTSQAGAILSFYLPLEQISTVTELIQIRDKHELPRIFRGE